MLMLTAANRAALPPLYSQDGKGLDALAVVKFFDPQGSFTWYASEFDGNDQFFGLVVSVMCPEGELGYFSLRELSTTRGRMGLTMERDLHWTPKPLGQCVPAKVPA